MTQAEPFLEICGVSKRFPGVLALDNVSFGIARGEVHALLGENGAGKTTLIKVLTGVFPPDGGEIRLNGSRVQFADPHAALQHGISAIFQVPSLVSALTVEQNILLGREPRRRFPGFLDRRQLNRQAAGLLARLDLKLDLRARAKSLSPGQQQMVAIAKAISIEAQLLIMDEPTASLTEEEANHLFAVIRDLRGQGISIIYVTHRMEEVFAIADRITVLRDGKYIATRPAAETDHAELVRMIVGRSVEVESFSRGRPPGDVALEVRNISRGRAFQDVSFQVRNGEIVALAGLVGSGRTEVVRAIFGAEPPQQGHITVRGRAGGPRGPAEAIRRRMSMVPEDRKTQGIVPLLAVRPNITLSSLGRYTRLSFVRRRAELAAVRRQIQQLQLVPAEPERRTSQLSGGNQQKVVLARALDADAEILILDEPTAGIDVGAKAELRRLIYNLAEQGKAILLVSSEIPEVLALADRILVMREGRLVGELNGEEADSEMIMHLAMTGAPQ